MTSRVLMTGLTGLGNANECYYPLMPKTLIQSVVGQLQKEAKRLENELHGVTSALAAFGRVYMQGNKRRPATTRKKRIISAAVRRRMAAAQKARWARVRAGNN
jgi:hypothetical protein